MRWFNAYFRTHPFPRTPPTLVVDFSVFPTVSLLKHQQLSRGFWYALILKKDLQKGSYTLSEGHCHSRVFDKVVREEAPCTVCKLNIASEPTKSRQCVPCSACSASYQHDRPTPHMLRQLGKAKGMKRATRLAQRRENCRPGDLRSGPIRLCVGR